MRKSPTPKPIYKEKDKSTLPTGKERLEKEIARMGLASRREAKSLIIEGKVTVNGKSITEPGYGIIPHKDTIGIVGIELQEKESILVYKPRGIETSRTTPTATDIHTLLPHARHLAPIGRLDKESEGLIILSNDGVLARTLTSTEGHIGKEYTVTTREQVTDASIMKMASGIPLDKIMTKPAVVTRLARTSFTIVLHEGRKHQIRRMCDACHLTIESLIRTKIGHLTIGSLRSGQSKNIAKKDVEELKRRGSNKKTIV